MNLSQLYYFIKLAELQHYTKAAKELFITQPSLSAAITSLEGELGLLLFQKKGRNVVLTKYGEEFYISVSQSLNELERGIALMKEHSNKLAGSIDIGCIPTLLGDFLPSAIKDYSLQHPYVKFNIFQGMSLEIANGVTTGKYDIGFCSKVDEEKDLSYIPITYEEIILLVNNNHILAKKDSIDIDELKKFDVATYRSSIPLGKIIKNLLTQHNIKATYSYDDEISIGGLISNTNMCAVVAKTSFLKQFTNLVYIPIRNIPKDTRLIYMAFSKKNYISSSVVAFTDFIVTNKLNLPKE